MDNKLKICFIISSLGGPKLLKDLFSKGYRSDVTYIIHQRMPSSEFMDALVDCLKEDLSIPVQYISKGATPLSPGKLYFLSNSHSYHLRGCLMQSQPNPGSVVDQPQLDALILNLHSQHSQMAVIALSGVLIDKDGISAIKKVHQHGCRVFATRRDLAPVTQMIDELSQESLVDFEGAPHQLLGRLHFPEMLENSAPETNIQPDPTVKWLVVDDEENVREVIGSILEFENIRCDYAADGLDALRKIQKHQYGALLLDIKMPEMDGLQTLTALQTIDPHIPILIVTGYDDKDTRQAAQKYSNVLGILLKPFMSEDLKQYLPHLMIRQNQV